MPKTTSQPKILTTTAQPQYTTAPLALPARCSVLQEKELERFPRSGERDPIFSQSRSQWYVLSVPCKANNFQPLIKSISIRKPGALRGVRCFVVASAKAYFAGLIAASETGGAEAEAESTTTDAAREKPKQQRRRRGA